MTRLILFAAVVGLTVSAGSQLRLAVADDKVEAKAAAVGLDGPKGEPLIGHMVYFKTKESTPAARQKLVEACNKYLSSHDGTVFYSAGVLSDQFKRDLNDRDWDVALHLVFVNKAAHDKYQDHPDHLKFIAENKDAWSKVRVFDSELADYKAMKK